MSVSPKTFRRWADLGFIPTVKIGPGITRYRTADLEALAGTGAPMNDEGPAGNGAPAKLGAGAADDEQS